jgi:outer membrane protein, multidrug efflux system
MTTALNTNTLRLTLLVGLLLSLNTLSNITPAQPVKTQAPLMPATLEYWQGLEGLPQVATRFPDAHWWERYQDPQLTRLIEQALLNNVDLKLASQHINTTQAQTGVGGKAALWPSLSLGPSFNRQRNSATLTSPSLRQFGFGGGSANTTNDPTNPTTGAATPAGGGGNLFAPGRTLNIYQMPLRLNYELDLLGRNWTRYKIDKLTVTQAQSDQRTMALTLVSDVAHHYTQWQHATAQLALNDALQQVVAHQQRLAQARLAAGLTTQTDTVKLTADAQQLLEQRQPWVQTQRQSLQNLALLLGQPTTPELQADATPLLATMLTPTMPEALNVGLPNELLSHRPDIQRAELQLAQQGLTVKLAKTQFFPTLTLTGQFGYASTRLKDLFKWDSHLLSYGASLGQDLFNGGSKLAFYRQQKSVYKERMLTYQKTLLQAYSEVENSLIDYKTAVDRTTALQNQLTQQQRQTALLNARQAQGLLSVLDVLPQRKAELQVQQGLLQQAAAQRTAEVILYKALGGGF